ncbi:hypothetical protein [Nostoc sp. JL31]|nr:hypothetical protein [Nostoc sp. JL31]
MFEANATKINLRHATFADFSSSSASMMRYTCSPLTSVLVEHHLL